MKHLIRKFIFVFIVATFLGCKTTMNVVNFENFYSYMEASIDENKDYIVIRTLISPYSYAVIAKYIFVKDENSLGNKYFLTFFVEGGDRKPDPAITYTDWGGIELRLSKFPFDSNQDKIFYRDEKGEYEIIIGSKESWQQYLEREFGSLSERERERANFLQKMRDMQREGK
ncbi:MAG: hypothetical protein NUV91_01715 [Candidatus Omnitrophica bacterium]|nr:hypothetical protein [Candidatus Omnitrophota bacterium]